MSIQPEPATEYQGGHQCPYVYNHVVDEPARQDIIYFIEEGKLGGPQVQMVRVAQALASRASIELVIPKNNNDAFRKLCDELGIAYCTRPISRLTREFLALLTYAWRTPFEVLALTRWMRSRKPALIHAWGGSWQFKAAIVARLAGVPCVWLLNDTYVPGYIRWLFARFARSCRAYISASGATQRYYAPLLPAGARSVVIQSMVDFDAFDPDASYPGDESLIASMEGETVIGLIANINPVKGIDTFIRVAARARASFHKCRFIIVGPTYRRQRALFEELKALAGQLGADNVVFAGGRIDVRPLLRRIDIYLCTSINESSPVSVWEAMAMARPVVSTPVGDVPEFVRDGETGFLAPVGDDGALWSATEKLVADPKLREMMGRAARARAQAALGREEIANQIWDFYQVAFADHQEAA